jgi:glycosyltransferase involved in cell wall biosynthesis
MADAARIVMFSPLPPKANGIADYCRELLGPLSQSIDCTVVVEDGTFRADAPPGIAILEAREYRGRAADLGDALHVYQMGNNRDHIYMLPFIAQRPGLLVLHDPVLHHLLDLATVGLGDTEGYCQALEAEYGSPGHVLARQFRNHRLRDSRMFFDLPMLGGLVAPARGVIVHSQYAAMKVLARVPEAAVHVVPHQFCPPAPARHRPPAATRARLGLAEDVFVLLSLGFVSRAKRLDDVLTALAQARDRLPPFHYVIAGEWRSEEIDLPAHISRLGLQDHVTLLGYVPDVEFFALLHAADVVVNLRHPAGGETSGAAIRALGTGACVVVVDRAAFAEIPDGAVVKLLWGPDIRTRLANELIALAHDPARRRQIGKAAASWVRSHCAPERTVAGYLRAIEQAVRTPAAEISSKTIWECPSPRELARLTRTAGVSTRHLPLWFRGGVVPGSAEPCRVLMVGGDSAHAELLARIGHLRPAIGEIATIAVAGIGSRTLDLILLIAELEDLPNDAAPLLRHLNRILSFGGVLAIDVRRRPSCGTAHPLERRIDGTALLRDCGFAVDCTTAAAVAGPSGGEVFGLNGRAWRAVKTCEFRISRTSPSRRNHTEATA